MYFDSSFGSHLELLNMKRYQLRLLILVIRYSQ